MEGLNLSNRLSCVAEWIKDAGNRRVADIGTDHGYLPIYLAQSGIADCCIAMDVREKPLARAKSHIEEYGVQDIVSVRLSDGLNELKAGEVDTITICGMGGRLIRSILENGRDRFDENTQLILSPQSEIREFRRFLVSSGYSVRREQFLQEDNQFYTIMECRYDPRFELYLRYGRQNLELQNEALHRYLIRELELDLGILDTVSKTGAVKRLEQVKEDIYFIRKALEEYYGGSVIEAREGKAE